MAVLCSCSSLAHLLPSQGVWHSLTRPQRHTPRSTLGYKSYARQQDDSTKVCERHLLATLLPIGQPPPPWR